VGLAIWHLQTASISATLCSLINYLPYEAQRQVNTELSLERGEREAVPEGARQGFSCPALF
jgi:hypothetical protein